MISILPNFPLHAYRWLCLRYCTNQYLEVLLPNFLFPAYRRSCLRYCVNAYLEVLLPNFAGQLHRTKKPPLTDILSVKDGQIYNSPRCHLDSCYDNMLFQDTNISLATDVCARHEILGQQNCAFPHALSGPFSSLHLQPFSAPGLSVSALTAFISTSTVCVPLFSFYYITPSLHMCQVLFIGIISF